MGDLNVSAYVGSIYHASSDFTDRSSDGILGLAYRAYVSVLRVCFAIFVCVMSFVCLISVFCVYTCQ